MTAAPRNRIVAAMPVPFAAPASRPLAGTGSRPLPDKRPLGQILMEVGAVAPGNLLKAVAMRGREDARLGEILLAHDWVSEADLMAALARQWGSRVVDLAAEPADPRMIDAMGAEFCLKNAVLPLRRAGGVTVIATSRPEDFRRLRADLPQADGPYAMALAPEPAIQKALRAQRQTALIRAAETRVAPALSCRDMGRGAGSGPLLPWLVLAAGLGLALIAPFALFVLALAWTLAALVSTTLLKLAAVTAEIRGRAREARSPPVPPPTIARLPKVSILVPLFSERDIAQRLIRRLGRLSYPRELLDVILIVEENDRQTREALESGRLPPWMRIIEVPDGPIRTKPRALNYALGYARGSIIGVYDAEDAPEPDQIHRIVSRFHARGPEVACLQGILDFYNPRSNWLSRCFTAEYAAWFRVILPGIARLGLAVPLGGTTLFFRREVLEALGGWDAHNVTEDADLGLRLARAGFVTELIDTVTEEEANCRALPWVKQRSRWLKGYWMTWRVHMRSPRLLWRELGPKRFWGVQVLFLGTLTQFLLAPVLWSFWVLPFGLPHPVADAMPGWAFWSLTGCFVMAEAVNLTVFAWAVRSPKHRHLWIWLPSMHFYFPLGALAAWKGFYEAAVRPFHWDKTQHGVFEPTQPLPASPGANTVAAAMAEPAAATRH